MRADNAVIIAAGTSSRFAPLSRERHKGLTIVRDEVLIERQLRQLIEAGIGKIYIVTGYRAEQFEYLKEKYGVRLIPNGEYKARNNHSSIWAAREVLGGSYICSADNYFTVNPFEAEVPEAYYAAEYAEGPTAEWCMHEGPEGFVDGVTIGGANAWYMIGHAFWSPEFSRRFLDILEGVYHEPWIRDRLWESVYREHLDVLRLKVRKYPPGTIYEFDTLDELRRFDSSYVDDTRSPLLKRLAARLGVREREITGIKPLMEADAEAQGFSFTCRGRKYLFHYDRDPATELQEKGGVLDA